MPSYAALTGHQPHISAAELSAVCVDIKPQRWFGTDYFVFQTNNDIDQKAFNHLGGSIVIAKSILEPGAKADLTDVPGLLHDQMQSVKGKAVFSLRFHGVGRSQVRSFYKDCKQYLKRQMMPSRYVGSQFEPAKAIQLHDEGVLDPKHGCELVILLGKDTKDVWIGRTVGAQDVKAYTLRDMEKPVRNMTVGILPPKLAQMLLNFGEYLVKLSGKDTKILTVLDPFCGTGVIPLETMARCWHVLASDVSLKAVNGAKKNIDWARKTFKFLKKDVTSTVWKQDAAEPFDLKEAPDVIVTEGTLGPPLSGRATQREAEKYAREAQELTEAFLENCSKAIPTVPIVMTWPVWYVRKQLVFLPKMHDLAMNLGYRPILPPHVDPTVGGRLSLLYRRPEQFVGREIVMLRPKR